MDDDDLPPDLVEAQDGNLAPQSLASSEPTNVSPASPRLIPITLLTGYLGSGKTTLLQYILKENHGYRIAVCMNDFSDTTDIEQTSLSFSNLSDRSSSQRPAQSGVTPDLVSDQGQGQDLSNHETRFLSLPNGCLCCSIKEPGIAAIENMITELEAINTSSTSTSSPSTSIHDDGVTPDPKPPGVDWLLIELTGLADPTEIAKSFWQNEEMGGRLRLDGIVGVVDCKGLEAQLRELPTLGGINECQKQIAASDVILLNKTDLVSEEEVEAAQATIQEINPTAMFKRTQRSRVPLEEIFRLGSYTLDADVTEDDRITRNLQVIKDATVSSGLRAGRRKVALGEHGMEDHGHDHEEAGSSHLSGVSSVVIDVPVLSTERFEEVEKVLQAVHWESRLPNAETRSEPEQDDQGAFQVLRSKGILNCDDGTVHVLQGVRNLFELTQTKPGSATGAPEQLKGKLVFIGRGLPELQVWKTALRL